jgi:hypothetical protein
VVGRLSQDRRGVLADEADDRRVCEGDVEGHISTKSFAIQANPIVEFSPDVLQNFQMAADELVHCPTAMLGHDEHVEAPQVHPICQPCEGVAMPAGALRSIESVVEVDQLQAFAVSGQTCMPEREVYFGRVEVTCGSSNKPVPSWGSVRGRFHWQVTASPTPAVERTTSQGCAALIPFVLALGRRFRDQRRLP